MSCRCCTATSDYPIRRLMVALQSPVRHVRAGQHATVALHPCALPLQQSPATQHYSRPLNTTITASAGIQAETHGSTEAPNAHAGALNRAQADANGSLTPATTQAETHSDTAPVNSEAERLNTSQADASLALSTTTTLLHVWSHQTVSLGQ